MIRVQIKLALEGLSAVLESFTIYLFCLVFNVKVR